MCGIAGFTGKPNQKLLYKMLMAIDHRGRDERISAYTGGFNIGMNRLSIVDLHRNLYPFKYKHLSLVYNGEIYNHKKLRELLGKAGVKFETNSDAEVILPLFDLYGIKSFAMLEGMFAVCIVDSSKRRIILSRDKFGEKPLYYSLQNSKFCFASEIKAIVPMIDNKSVKPDSVANYLTRGYVPGCGTLLSQVFKLKPAEYLIYDPNKKSIKTDIFWKPEITVIPDKQIRNYPTELSMIQKLDRLISDSVSKRLLADVPLGLFLSGGVDSSLIGYYASQKIKHLKSYSIRFPGNFRYNESFFSGYISGQLSTEHTEIECSAKKCLPFLAEIGKYIDDPVSDPAVLPTLLMSQVARKSVKAVLTGEGADEVFAGYPRYGRQLFLEKVRKQKLLFNFILTVNRLLPGRFKNIKLELNERYHTQNIWKSGEINFLFNNNGQNQSQLYRTDLINRNVLQAMQLSDMEGYLAEQLLMKVDKSTMALNLEARAPFLDAAVTEYGLNLPDRYKTGSGGKYLLKKVAGMYFPKWFVRRPKHGFSVPLKDWFCGEFRDNVRESVADIGKYAPSLNLAYYQKTVDDHLERRENNEDKIWSLLVLGNWLKYHRIIL